MGVYEWRRLSWPEFRALPAGPLLAVLPLGALEAHGPHLPLGTDIAIADAMARAGADRLSRHGFEVVLLPPLPIAPAPFAADFEGTIDTAPTATTLLISGIAQSAARHRVRATVIANAHHDPAHVRAIREAVDIVQRDRSATLIFPDLTRRRWAARLTDEFLSGACHAGRYETSAVLAAAPDMVRRDMLPGLGPNPRSLVDAIQRGDRTFAEAGGPQAYFGWPADATAEEGREIIDRLGAILEEAVLEELAERRTTNEEPGPKSEEDKTGPLNPGTQEPRNPGTVEPRNFGFEIVTPASLGHARGFSHGVVTPAGWRALYVAGQTAADPRGGYQPDFAAQFGTALDKVLDVVRAAGGEAAHIARMTVFVTDVAVYRASRRALKEIWVRRMGDHYPAMALVEVQGLVDEDAMVEIQADAVVPPGP